MLFRSAAQTVATNATGRASFATITPGALPQNVYVRMVGAQANANGHGFTRTNTAERGTPVGSFLRYTINGLTLTADTVDLGDHRVKYTDSDVFVRVYHETNDTAKWQTAGDDAGFADVANMNVGMRYKNGAGTVVNVAAQAAAAGGNTFLNIPTGVTEYTIWAVQGAVGLGEIGRAHV